MNKTEKRVYDLASPVAQDFGCYIYAVEFVKEGPDKHLIIYADKEGGISLTDCEDISRAMNNLLDKDDFIEEKYILEVSSPGVERKLTEDWHFEKYIGSSVEVSLYSPINGSKKHIGTLSGYADGKIIIDVNGETIVFDKKAVGSVNIHFEF